LVPKFKTNHRWSCVSSELSWVEVSRLFLDHGSRVEVSRTTFLVSKCLETGAEVSQSVLMPKCFVIEVSGNQRTLGKKATPPDSHCLVITAIVSTPTLQTILTPRWLHSISAHICGTCSKLTSHLQMHCYRAIRS